MPVEPPEFPVFSDFTFPFRLEPKLHSSHASVLSKSYTSPNLPNPYDHN
jgi:hypothetical protein